MLLIWFSLWTTVQHLTVFNCGFDRSPFHGMPSAVYKTHHRFGSGNLRVFLSHTSVGGAVRLCVVWLCHLGRISSHVVTLRSLLPFSIPMMMVVQPVSLIPKLRHLPGHCSTAVRCVAHCAAQDTARPVLGGEGTDPPPAALSFRNTESPRSSVLVDNLPPPFLAFLRDNDLDSEVYGRSHLLPRYIRWGMLFLIMCPLTETTECLIGDSLHMFEDFLVHWRVRGWLKTLWFAHTNSHVSTLGMWGFLRPPYDLQTCLTRWMTLSCQPTRMKNGTDSSLLACQLAEEIGVLPQPVPWLPGFYSLPPHVAISRTQLYKSGQVLHSPRRQCTYRHIQMCVYEYTMIACFLYACTSVHARVYAYPSRGSHRIIWSHFGSHAEIRKSQSNICFLTIGDYCHARCHEPSEQQGVHPLSHHPYVYFAL